MYGGCTGDVRLDIAQIPYGYHTDITEPLPLGAWLAQGAGIARVDVFMHDKSDDGDEEQVDEH